MDTGGSAPRSRGGGARAPDAAGTGVPAAGREPHPRERAAAPDDPLLLSAQPAAGDPELMLVTLVEEFAHQGFDEQRLLRLFESPFFGATSLLRQHFGEDGVRTRVRATLRRCGVLRTTTRHGPPACAPRTPGGCDG